ncbi:uncharacterized protein LOC142590433 isoform X3 [Dermacentor variabilis]|uniref:uncharacterized protein LOC142590433 isoform X3 n=1 Tax=Dermacentor variabilis TaxID=34621 RepID=UPI003F5C2373
METGTVARAVLWRMGAELGRELPMEKRARAGKLASQLLSLTSTFKASAHVSCARQDRAYLCTDDNNYLQVLIAAGCLSPESGLTNAMSLAESITAKMACHAPSKIGGQVEVGMQHSLPLADKSVGCSLKPGSESRSVQTTEAVEQLSSTSGACGCCGIAQAEANTGLFLAKLKLVSSIK